MAATGEYESRLSVQRAFVVHLGTGGRPGRRRFHGRVEHLPSGESARFSSLKGLLAFFAAALDEPGRGAPLQRKDHTRTGRLSTPS